MSHKTSSPVFIPFIIQIMGAAGFCAFIMGAIACVYGIYRYNSAVYASYSDMLAAFGGGGIAIAGLLFIGIVELAEVLFSIEANTRKTTQVLSVACKTS